MTSVMNCGMCFVMRLCGSSLDKHVLNFIRICDKGTLRTPKIVVRYSVCYLHSPRFFSVKFCQESYVESERTDVKYLKRIQKIFGFSQVQAQRLLLERSLHECQNNELPTNVEHVKQQGISFTVIQENPWISTFSQDSLDARLSLIKNLDFENIEDGVPLIQIYFSRLASLCLFWRKEFDCFSGRSRIKYISEKLQCPVSVVCQLFVKYRFLQMMESSRLKKNLDLLLNAGVSPNNILKDVWSLRTKSEFVEERLCRANEVGLPDPKPWLVRCQIEVFERTLERHTQSRAILGSKSFHQFLADRLDCDVQAATVMVQRYPTVLHVNIPKINEILDFLREEGFSMEQVLQVPRILCHSLETTRARLRQLHALGFHPVSLMVLCLSQPDYLKMVRRLEQRRAKVAQ